MGISEDIQWLDDDKEGLKKVFLLIAGRGKITIRELKERYGSKNWWPVKSYARALVDRGLVAERDYVYGLTDYGKKVREGSKALGYVQEFA